jgi:hypothetical protein
MPKNGKLVTVANHDLRTSYRVNIPQDGVISARVRRLCAARLRTPPGYPGAGPLGEVGPQEPPETPGWGYTFESLKGGGVKATPHQLGKAVGE